MWSDIPGVCLWCWDIPTDQLTWSDELCELYGVDAAPPDSDAFLAMIHPSDRERVEADTIGFVASGETFDHEFRIVRSDGQVRWVIDRGRIHRDRAGRPLRIVGVNIDVTQLKAESEAQRSAERRSAFSAKIGGLVSWEIDMATGGITSESGLAELFGLPLDGAMPKNMSGFLDRIHPDDLPRVLAAFEAAKFPGGEYKVEYRVKRGDGWSWTRAQAQAAMVEGSLHLIGFNVDIEHERLKNAHVELIAQELAHRVKNTLSVLKIR